MKHVHFFFHAFSVSLLGIVMLILISLRIYGVSLSNNPIVATATAFWWLFPLCALITFFQGNVFEDPDVRDYSGLRAMTALHWVVHGGCALWVMLEIVVRPENPRVLGFICLLAACGGEMGHTIRSIRRARAVT